MYLRLVTLFLGLLLAGCAHSVPPSIVSMPTTVRPVAKPLPQPANGAIFQAAASRALFEDRQPHQIGDNITVQIQEQVSASSQSNNTAERNGSATTKVSAGGNSKTFGNLLNGLNMDLSHDNKFAGKGQTSASNTFTGQITVTVNDILPNGNLAIAGEKQVNIRGEISYLRVSGVVSPRDILAGNVVSSTKIAEARIEEMGTGAVASADKAGWLQQFFFSFLPF
ncbi:flagellar basal body L-ring protein FlgH [Chitinimonas sp.]|uniref:flagellar basal body L-ring protein FlgH n=1 Tax=Chitinimonas sp. TaxID=1934313 RepID=UPI0035AF52E2